MKNINKGRDETNINKRRDETNVNKRRDEKNVDKGEIKKSFFFVSSDKREREKGATVRVNDYNDDGRFANYRSVWLALALPRCHEDL